LKKGDRLDFKILAIDGGGIRGLYAAWILNEFEKDIKKKYSGDALIGDFVDLVCGTSTGGLIALGIAHRIPMEEIVDLYLMSGPLIFQSSQSPLKKIRQIFWGSKYRNIELKVQLEKIFGQKRIGDGRNLLCIPSYDFTNGTYEVFKFDHTEGNLSRHNSLKVVDVALATSAAPTYFPVSSIKSEGNRLFVDGGIWCNNPTLVGYLEAIKYFVGKDKKYNTLKMLSISSLPTRSGIKPSARLNRSVLDWGTKIFDMGITSQSEFTHIFMNNMKQMLDSIVKYHRITKVVDVPDHIRLLSLDNASKPALDILLQYAQDTYYIHKNKDFIKDYWGSLKSYNI